MAKRDDVMDSLLLRVAERRLMLLLIGGDEIGKIVFSFKLAFRPKC